MEINKEWFKEKINIFLMNDASNKMSIDGSYIFEPDVLVGFASGNDKIFEDYKKIIGSFHLTPLEAFEKYYKKTKKSNSLKMENISVVAYILPINKKTKDQNLEFSKKMPSERWSHTRLFGEQANQKLQNYLVDELQKIGIEALAPGNQLYMFKVHQKHENGVWASTFSFRHMAFAAGLGSFGLSDGFINEKGKAMRCGSIIVNYKLPSDADKRPKDPYFYCNKCGNCIQRCPVGAISFETRHDKQKCSEHVMGTVPFIKENYGINIYSCGLCQVGVSCENGIPLKKE
jgi:epoxyqueuosine reductase QueG